MRGIPDSLKKKVYIIKKSIDHDCGGNGRISHNFACDYINFTGVKYFVQPVKIVNKGYVCYAGFAFNLHPEFLIAVKKIYKGRLPGLTQE